MKPFPMTPGPRTLYVIFILKVAILDFVAARDFFVSQTYIIYKQSM